MDRILNSPVSKRTWLPLVITLITAGMAGCSGAPASAEGETASIVQGDGTAPEWSHNAVIYEVNVRQYSPSGTFDAVTADLDRIDELGVDILWLMPIHPVGEARRKGSLGSYYAVKDYQGVNPEFGTEADFRELVQGAHERGMKVILDWVANHSAWDNPWITEHPDWYVTDSTGTIVAPVADWSDVADLNYDAPGMRNAMTEALAYWVREFDVDGYRCDVAGMVPYPFWDSVRVVLDAIKPVFMLAEWDDPAIHSAFDMTYTWDLHHRMNEIAKGHMPLDSLDAYFAGKGARYAAEDYRMVFTSNHDENSWNGTVFERMGEGAQAMAVLAYTIPGMPLIYSGQEAPMRKRLAFFDKDTIDWNGYEWQPFYEQLNALKHSQPALWNGIHGGPMQRLASSADDRLYAFARGENKDVVVFLNLSDAPLKASLSASISGTYKDGLGNAGSQDGLESISLPAWGYQVWVRP